MASPKEIIELASNTAQWLNKHAVFGWLLILLFIIAAGSMAYSQNDFEARNTDKIDGFSCSLEEMSQDLKSLKDDNVVFTSEMIKFENRIDVMEGKLDLIIEMAKSK